MEYKPLKSAKGLNGTVELFKDRVLIKRKTLSPSIHGFNADIVLLFEEISRIQFKPATMLTNGFIRFVSVNSDKGKDINIFQAAQDKHSVIFMKKHLKNFIDIKNYLEKAIIKHIEHREKAPEIIKWIRKIYKNTPDRELTETYYQLLNLAIGAKARGDYKKLVEYYQTMYGLTEILVRYTKKEYGRFDIRGIPPIEEGSFFFGLFGLKGQLLNLKEIVEYIPELEAWKKYIDEGFKVLELTPKIIKEIEKHPGIFQTKIKEVVFESDGRLIARILYYLEKMGRIRRIKEGKRYKVFLN